MRRTAAAVFAFVATALLLLEPFEPSGATTQVQATESGYSHRNQPDVPLQEEFCEPIWAEESPRFLAYDAVLDPTEHRMGPELTGDAAQSVMVSLKHRICLDAAYMFDLESYVNFGYYAEVDADDRERMIEDMIWGERVLWSDRAETLFNMITFGKPKLYEANDSLRSWFYRTGAAPSEVPDLHEGALTSELTDLLGFIGRDGQLRELRLKCGGQPVLRANAPMPAWLP